MLVFLHAALRDNAWACFSLTALHCDLSQIDAVAKVRDGRMRSVGNDEREQTLNQLLTVSAGSLPSENGSRGWSKAPLNM